MRAARLLEILLLLQNRGRMNSAQLAAELEVSRRTILRDVDAMNEAGLPVIVYQGNAGGIELGFNYRTRLTGLAADEAEALAVILSYPIHELEELGMKQSAMRARRKLVESFPDIVRNRVQVANKRFKISREDIKSIDPRIKAVTKAIRKCRIITIRSRSKNPMRVHPCGLIRKNSTWYLIDEQKIQGQENTIPLNQWGDINISMRNFNSMT